MKLKLQISTEMLLLIDHFESSSLHVVKNCYFWGECVALSRTLMASYSTDSVPDQDFGDEL